MARQTTNNQDAQNMCRALRLAKRGLGRVEPNPMVGCVIIRSGRIIGEGYHRQFGGPHAEVEALRDCAARGENPSDADVYVTLEPCCHWGKTGPCVDALIEARVGKVWAAMTDPDPRVCGRGAERLRAAGIEVEIGLHQREAQSLNAPFIKRTTHGLPWVIAKWAQTVDGRIATAGGDSRWVSNDQSRRKVHELRARVDAIVVGIGTVLADDPELTARGVPVKRRARRVVIDPQLRLPLQSKLVRSLTERKAPPLTVVTYADSKRCHELAAMGVDLVMLESSGKRFSLRAVLEHLAKQHEASNVLVEGGSKVFGSLFAERLADELLVFVGSKLAGDATALPAVQGLTCPTMNDLIQLDLKNVTRLEDDIMLDYLIR